MIEFLQWTIIFVCVGAAGVGFLSPILLVVWEVGFGHRSKRGRPQRVSFRWSLAACFISITILAVMLAIWRDVRVGVVLTAGVTIWLLSAAARSILEDLRGSRARLRFAPTENDETITLDHLGAESESAEAAEPTPGPRKRWWAKRTPAIRFTRYGIWS